MKTNLFIHDQTCPQPPVIRKFATEEMKSLVQKDPRITSIRLKLCKLPHSRAAEAYRIQVIAKGRGATTQSYAHATTVRAALQSVRSKMIRRLVRQSTRSPYHSIGIQLKA